MEARANEYLVLVNRDHPILKEQPEDLIAIGAVKLRAEAAKALQALMDAIDGWQQIVPTSGYRPREEQEALYAQSLKDHGQDYTRQFVALPGHSEHQTGLAVDVALHQKDIDLICPAFPYEGICQRFRLTAPSFGFIERYPAGKETITGIAHEPWHFRFVGVPHAQRIMTSGATLEEYDAG